MIPDLHRESRFGRRAGGGLRSSEARERRGFRFRGRSLLAFALVPEHPIADWLAELDRWMCKSGDFFAGRPVVLDVSTAKLERHGFVELVGELEARGIRLMGVEGADPSWLGRGLPPLIKGGGPVGGIELTEPPAPRGRPASKPAPQPEATSLLLDA